MEIKNHDFECKVAHNEFASIVDELGIFTRIQGKNLLLQIINTVLYAYYTYLHTQMQKVLFGYI